MFVEAEGFGPWISPCRGDMLAIYITAPFLLHFYYTTNILKIQMQNNKKNKTQVSILSLLRLISGIYVVFNLNSIFYVRNNLNDCLSFSHAISLPIKISEMRGKLLYVLCKFFIFFYLYIFSSNVNINSM